MELTRSRRGLFGKRAGWFLGTSRMLNEKTLDEARAEGESLIFKDPPVSRGRNEMEISPLEGEIGQVEGIEMLIAYES